MADQPKFYPTLVITNMKSLLLITLDNDSSQYISWAALFKVQAWVHNVLDHIVPPTDEKAKKAIDNAKAVDPDLWHHLDAVVLQWMYATISQDILNSILVIDDSAKQCWKRIVVIFQDNKHSRVVHLENQFSNINLDDF